MRIIVKNLEQLRRFRSVRECTSYTALLTSCFSSNDAIAAISAAQCIYSRINNDGVCQNKIYDRSSTE